MKDPIIDLDVGVNRRNKELCKPYIRLFYGSKPQREVEQTFQIFLNAKNEKKATSLEATLVPIIIKLIEYEPNDGQGLYFSSHIWEFIRHNTRRRILCRPQCNRYFGL